MANTRIMRCVCKHEYQDEKCGKQMRVHNRKGNDGGWVCTVCRAEKR